MWTQCGMCGSDRADAGPAGIFRPRRRTSRACWSGDVAGKAHPATLPMYTDKAFPAMFNIALTRRGYLPLVARQGP